VIIRDQKRLKAEGRLDSLLKEMHQHQHGLLIKLHLKTTLKLMDEFNLTQADFLTTATQKELALKKQTLKRQ